MAGLSVFFEWCSLTGWRVHATGGCAVDGPDHVAYGPWSYLPEDRGRAAM